MLLLRPLSVGEARAAKMQGLKTGPPVLHVNGRLLAARGDRFCWLGNGVAQGYCEPDEQAAAGAILQHEVVVGTVEVL